MILYEEDFNAFVSINEAVLWKLYEEEHSLISFVGFCEFQHNFNPVITYH